MRCTRWPLAPAFLAFSLAPGFVDEAPAQQAPAAESVEAIDRAFQQAKTELELQRFGRLAALAASQPADQAARTNEHLMQLAIDSDLYAQAEPFADKILAKPDNPTLVYFLASFVNIIAEADRGAFDESSRDLKAAIARSKQKSERESDYPAASVVITLSEAYYQRLLSGGRIDIARKDFAEALTVATDPAVIDYLKGHLARLEMVGQPAPPIVGTDLDGRPVNLSELKGSPVLVVFWATWQATNTDQVRAIRDALAAYQAKGLKVIGVNLDSVESGAGSPAAVLAKVRKYVLDVNITWPTLINGEKAQDIASAYRITEIPASVLIDGEGKVVDLDINRGSLSKAIAKVFEVR